MRSFQSLPCFWPLRAAQTSLCSWCHRWHHHLLNSDVVSGCNLIPGWRFSFHTDGFSKKTAGEPKNSLTKWYYFERVLIDRPTSCCVFIVCLKWNSVVVPYWFLIDVLWNKTAKKQSDLIREVFSQTLEPPKRLTFYKMPQRSKLQDINEKDAH